MTGAPTCDGAAAAPIPSPPPAGAAGGGAAEVVRLTWVQPEDLLGHEFRQAAEDGRAAAAEPLLRTWLDAGGRPAPPGRAAPPPPPPRSSASWPNAS